MGFSTGADKMLPRAHQARHNPSNRKTSASALKGALGLWGALGTGAVGILVWLAVDLGGPSQMVSAFYAVGGSSSQWAAIRQDLNRLAEARANVAPGRNEDVATLKRRVAMLEGMVKNASGTIPAPSTAPIGNVAAMRRIGAPRTTAAIPRAKPLPSVAERFAPLKSKADLPGKPAKRTTRPPTYLASRVVPNSLMPAPDAAKRSRLAPEAVFGLDLGVYESIEVLKRRWKQVEGRHQDVLGDLIPRRITEFAANGRIAHRLIAAPLDTAMEVARRCATLQARSVPCRQTLGAGEPL